MQLFQEYAELDDEEDEGEKDALELSQRAQEAAIKRRSGEYAIPGEQQKASKILNESPPGPKPGTPNSSSYVDNGGSSSRLPQIRSAHRGGSVSREKIPVVHSVRYISKYERLLNG